jgi:hypothetical protein
MARMLLSTLPAVRARGKDAPAARRPHFVACASPCARGDISMSTMRRACYGRRVRLPAILVIAILVAGSAAARADEVGDVNAAAADAVQGLQQRIVADPEMAASIQALRDDPQVQAVLSDPAITAALARGDMAALLSDPKIRDLADDPAVQRITRQVAR